MNPIVFTTIYVPVKICSQIPRDCDYYSTCFQILFMFLFPCEGSELLNKFLVILAKNSCALLLNPFYVINNIRPYQMNVNLCVQILLDVYVIYQGSFFFL